MIFILLEKCEILFLLQFLPQTFKRCRIETGSIFVTSRSWQMATILRGNSKFLFLYENSCILIKILLESMLTQI